MVDDLVLETGDLSDPRVIIKASASEDISSVDEFKQHILDNTAKVLSNYYWIHPLTLAGFNHQVKALIGQKGVGNFAAISGKMPGYTLFVDGGEVVAETPDSPRFRYGAFLEFERTVANELIESTVKKWVERGDAYELYLNMNVCRYNC